MFEANLRRWLWAAAWVAALALAGANLWFGDLNQDEGWYLYAARQVSEGKVLYRDFAFPQGPALPLLYAAVYPFVEWGGVAAGRVFSVLLGLMTALVASSVAARLAPSNHGRAAGLLAFVLIAVNVYQSYYFALVKTYSVAALFLAGSVFALVCVGERRAAWPAFAAGGLALLATAARTSAGIVLPIMALYLFVERRRFGARCWFAYCAGALLAGALVLLPFAVMAWDNFHFFVFKYHTLRHSGGILSALVYKAGFVSRLIMAYMAALALGGAVCLARFLKIGSAEARAGGARRALNLTLWGVVLAISLVHFSAPFPYDDYQVMVYPVFVACVAAAALRAADAMRGNVVSWVLSAVFMAGLLAAVSSPINQDWFLLERDRIWWRLKDRSSLAKLRETAGSLRAMAGTGGPILTQDPYLAVETGMRLPHGLEMGQFSYFPDFDRARADRLNVLNRETFLELLENCRAPVAALSGYAFAIESPAITPVPPVDEAAFRAVVERRYEKTGHVSHFGQALTDLALYRLKDSKGTP